MVKRALPTWSSIYPYTRIGTRHIPNGPCLLPRDSDIHIYYKLTVYLTVRSIHREHDGYVWI